MDIQYFGANSLKISTKKLVLTIDPQSDIAKLQTDLKKVNSLLVTQPQFKPAGIDVNTIFVVDGPGEYEFEDCSIKGIAAQPHTAGTASEQSATMYRVSAGEIKVLVTGHISPKLSEEQLEAIGLVDVVVVPVGGGGYTLDAVEAATVVRAIEPKMVIPVHAKDDGFTYEVPQGEIELFCKELGAPILEDKVEKLKLKNLPDQLSVQIVTRS